MTKQNFENIAYIINTANHLYRGDDTSLRAIKHIQGHLAEYFGQVNPLFNTQKFNIACEKGKHIRASIRNA